MNRVLLLIILLIGLFLRIYAVHVNSYVIDSDEAIVGLMAKHINNDFRDSLPIFYYGQDYMGSLEAILTSVVFKLFGQNNFNLKLIPIIFSVLHIWLSYLLARCFLNQRFSLLAALFCAFAPNALILWSSKTRGGFIEIVALGSLCFLLAFKVLDFSKIRLNLCLLTFFLGLGWWTNNQIVFYIVPMAFFCGYTAFIKESYLGFLKLSLLSIFSFILGSFPFWLANVFAEPRWATFKVLFGETATVDVVKNAKGYLREAIPMILGAKKFWTDEDFFYGSSALAYLLFISALILSLFFCARKKELKKLALVFSFFASVGLIFCFSKFGWLSMAPRYLLPLYSVLPIIYALAVAYLFEKFGKITAASYSLAIVFIQTFPVLMPSGLIEGMPIVYLGQRVQRDHRELYSWLEKEGYSFIDTNYWIGYRVAFETDEKVKFRVFGEPKTVRIKEYEQSEPPLVYVLVPLEANQVKNTLTHFGFTFRETQVSGYVVVDKIVSQWKLDQNIPITSAQIKSAFKPENLALMLDDNVNTRWGSASPQSPGMSIDIDLNNRQITALELDFGNFTHDAPRHLQVYGLVNDWELLSDLGDLGDVFSYFPDDNGRPSHKWIIRFSPRKLKAIRLVQQGRHPIFDWSIAELKLYGSKE